MKPNRKKLLYRKVNNRARGAHHNFGGDYRNIRNKESSIGMSQGIQRSLDYTPIFRFFLSKVGSNWDDIHSEAVSRLDKQEPIFWIVAKNIESADDYLRVGESSYFSGLFIDSNNILQIVSPEITEKTLEPLCKCCTHTFNDIQFTRTIRE